MARIGFDAKRYFKNTTGLGNYSRWLVKLIAQSKKHQLFLFHSKPEKEAGLPVIGPSNFKLSSKLWRVRGIVKDLQKQRIDLYHGLSNELPFGIHKSGIKTVVTVHDLIQKRYPENYKLVDRTIYNRKIKYAQNYADAIVVPSTQTKKDLIHYFQTAEEKIHVIPLGIPSALKAEANRHPKPYILCVSGFSRRKNLVRLVRAFKDSQIKDVDLIIAGKKGDMFNRVHYLSRNNDNIVLMPDISEQTKADLYAHAEFCIYPSLYEGFGIPVLEAFTYGKALATSKTSSLTEVGGKGAIYFDPENSTSITHCLETLHFSTEHRKHLEAEIEGQMKLFNNESITNKYLELYSSILPV